MSLELSGTTGLKGVAGSVAAPSIVGDDTNTGISFPSADTIKFSTGGVERMSITNDGVSASGHIIQVLENFRPDASSHTINSGAVYEPTFLRQSITNTGSNKILVEGVIGLAMTSAGNSLHVGLLRDDSLVGGGVASGNKRLCISSSFNKDNYNMTPIFFSFLDSPSAGTHEYHLQISHGSGGNQTVYVNRTHNDNNDTSSPRTSSFIRCMEVAV